ncbi:hypothetical protein J1605_021012 [Eschrichtius robustus]|uniref:Uncharacterized protein n=1 Tax=Eschrichtius robustus TaxID=9764 RepID=A0AB34HI74_ESCRO|nr:hypothetical protein J1605_021012 [Eschrichtius robustus]
MWDLPGLGLEPVSPALAGGFLTTAPPGKPNPAVCNKREWALRHVPQAGRPLSLEHHRVLVTRAHGLSGPDFMDKGDLALQHSSFQKEGHGPITSGTPDRVAEPPDASFGHEFAGEKKCKAFTTFDPYYIPRTESPTTGFRRAGSAIVAHGPSCSAACGIFPDQGLNPCPLHWQADSQPLRHQGSPGQSLLN